MLLGCCWLFALCSCSLFSVVSCLLLVVCSLLLFVVCYLFLPVVVGLYTCCCWRLVGCLLLLDYLGVLESCVPAFPHPVYLSICSPHAYYIMSIPFCSLQASASARRTSSSRLKGPDPFCWFVTLFPFGYVLICFPVAYLGQIVAWPAT